jgi:beta-lactamase superfamily II metal-dependent hydrolase
LIDGGTPGSYTQWKPLLDKLLGERQVLDLLVVTHIDSDHIGGIIRLLDDPNRQIDIKQIWFNGYEHVLAADKAINGGDEYLSPTQGDALSASIKANEIAWNTSFDGKPIRSISDTILIGQVAISVLLPDNRQLSRLRPIWDQVRQEAVLKESKKREEAGVELLGTGSLDIAALAASADALDTAKPNGSSIVLLCETLGRRILLAGDSHPNALADACRKRDRIAECPLSIDLFKVPHHGAKSNMSTELMNAIDCGKIAISTDGTGHDHPHNEAIAKIITVGTRNKVLHFNYRQPHVESWNDADLMAKHGYTTQFSAEGADGHIHIEIGAP